MAFHSQITPTQKAMYCLNVEHTGNTEDTTQQDVEMKILILSTDLLLKAILIC